MLNRAVVSLALLLLLAFSPVAPANADPVASGRVGYKLDGDLYKLLKEEGVQIRRLKPGRVQGRTISLPVGAGQLLPGAGSGQLFSEGGVRLKSGRRSVVLRGFVLDTENGWLSARLAGRRLELARTGQVESMRKGFGARAAVEDLELTAKAARVLNRGLGVRNVFRGGQPLATASVLVRFEELTITGGTIYFAPDSSFSAKLDSLEVEIVPFEATEPYAHSSPGFAIPDIQGSVALDLSSGAMGSQNGLTLIQRGTGGSKQVGLLGISLGFESKIASADIRAQPAGTGGVAPFASVAFSTVHTNPISGVISIPNTPATISPQLADSLSATFDRLKEPIVFSAGEPLGVFAFVVQTR